MQYNLCIGRKIYLYWHEGRSDDKLIYYLNQCDNNSGRLHWICPIEVDFWE